MSALADDSAGPTSIIDFEKKPTETQYLNGIRFLNQAVEAGTLTVLRWEDEKVQYIGTVPPTDPSRPFPGATQYFVSTRAHLPTRFNVITRMRQDDATFIGFPELAWTVTMPHLFSPRDWRYIRDPDPTRAPFEVVKFFPNRDPEQTLTSTSIRPYALQNVDDSYFHQVPGDSEIAQRLHTIVEALMSNATNTQYRHVFPRDGLLMCQEKTFDTIWRFGFGDFEQLNHDLGQFGPDDESIRSSFPSAATIGDLVNTYLHRSQAQ